MANVLVAGGAGYIGAHTCLDLFSECFTPVVYDNLSNDLDRYQGFRSCILRYFNAAGADPEGRIGEWHSPETHAIPIAIEAALGRRPHFQVLGTDYDTRDGSCVRDFVHVVDLADAHTRAIEHLLNGRPSRALKPGT